MARRFSGWLAGGMLMILPGAVIAAEPAAEPEGDLFQQLDANHDGALTSEEIPSDKQRLFKRLLRSSDANKDGKISRDEFAQGLKDNQPARPLDEKSPGSLGGPGGLPDPVQLFNRLDANKDGKITANEVPDEASERFGQLLARADKDGDGALTQQEVSDGIKSFARDFKAAGDAARDPHQIFKYLDTDGDGKIVADDVPEGRRDGFKRLLPLFDRDRDGKMNEEEFVAAMSLVRGLQGDKSEEGANRRNARPDSSNIERRSDAAADMPADSAGSRSSADPGDKPRGDKQRRDQQRRPEAARDRAARVRRSVDPEMFGQRMHDRLMSLDKDHDGRISREEFNGPLSEQFNKLDANHDGVIDSQEIDDRVNQMKSRLEGAKSVAPVQERDKPAEQTPSKD